VISWIVGLLCLPLLLWLPGAVLLRALFGPTGPARTDGAGWAFLAIAGSVLWTGWLGFTLAEIGWFSLGLLVAGTLLACLAVVAFAAGERRAVGPTLRGWLGELGARAALHARRWLPGRLPPGVGRPHGETIVLVVLLLMLWAPAAKAWTWPVQGPVLLGFAFDPAHPYAAGQHRGIDIGSETGTAVLAPAAVPLIFGDRWMASAKIAQILGLLAVPFTLNRFAGPALAALNQTATLARLAALQVTLSIVLSIAAAPYGLTAMAWAYVLRAYLTLPVQMRAFKKHSGLGYGAVLRSIAPALAMATVMAISLLGLGHVVGDRFHSRALFLAFMCAVGAVLYGGALLLFARGFVLQQLGDFRLLLPNGRARLSSADARP